jgi:hypothetical protein
MKTMYSTRTPRSSEGGTHACSCWRSQHRRDPRGHSHHHGDRVVRPPSLTSRGPLNQRAEDSLSRFISFVFTLVYLIVGVVVAASHHYFEHLDAVKPIASAALAVLLWPLVLFGVNLHLK